MLLTPGEVSETGDAHVSGPRGDHLRLVLRVRAGQQIRIGLVDGPHGIDFPSRAHRSAAGSPQSALLEKLARLALEN